MSSDALNAPLWASAQIDAVKVGRKVWEAQLRQPRGPPSLPGDRLELARPLGDRALSCGWPLPPDTGLTDQVPDPDKVGAKLGGDGGLRPLPVQEPVGQIRPDILKPSWATRAVIRCSARWRRCSANRSGRGGSTISRVVIALVMVHWLTPSSSASPGMLRPLSQRACSMLRRSWNPSRRACRSSRRPWPSSTLNPPRMTS